MLEKDHTIQCLCGQAIPKKKALGHSKDCSDFKVAFGALADLLIKAINSVNDKNSLISLRTVLHNARVLCKGRIKEIKGNNKSRIPSYTGM